MKKLKERWAARGWGLDLGGGERLQNLRFADDVLIIGTSLLEVQRMLEDLSIEAKIAGLNIHPEKTKMLANSKGRQGSETNKEVIMEVMEVEVPGV